MPERRTLSAAWVLEADPAVYSFISTHARGPEGALPITAEMLLTQPSGNLFGLSQNAGMGWDPRRLLDPEFLILSTHGGLRGADGTPIALGLHTGHWDARFSGVSTGACIGHVSPEALAGGPVGKVLEGDLIEIEIDRGALTGRVNLVGDATGEFSAEEGARRLTARKPRTDLQPHPDLPEDTRLWAALVNASGGVWGGCVYDTEMIVASLEKRN